MGEVGLNSFNKGMMQDAGKTLPQDGSYLEGRNLRVVSNEDSAESGIAVNVDGNVFSFELEIPCGDPFLSPCQMAWVEGGSIEFYSGITIQLGDLVSDSSGMIWYWNGVSGTIYNEPDLWDKAYRCGFSYTDTDAPSAWIDPYTGGYLQDYPNLIQDNSTATIPENIEDYIDADGSLVISEDTCPVCLIGWAAIRDTLYLFATNNETFNPGGVFTEIDSDPSSTGYIFKQEFNLVNNNPLTDSPVLMYSHNELNFSKAHQIEAIGRYETEDIQKLYWTDNYNPPRTINVKNPEIVNFTPDELNLNPTIDFTAPDVLEVRDGGDLPSGMYQYAYRLRNELGAETRFSPFTGLVHIVKSAEAGSKYWMYTEDPENIIEYSGNAPGEVCNKSVKLKITNIDTEYDVIEIAAIYRSTEEGVTNAYIFDKTVLAGRTEIEAIHHTNTGIISLITLAELTSYTNYIARVKSLASKDNRLFIGNIITPETQLEFNARAYRYKRGDEEVYVNTDTDNVLTYVDEDFDPLAFYVENPDVYEDEGFDNTLQDNLDAINPYNDLLAVEDGTLSYKYKKNGLTLGGDGPNVSYSFTKKIISGDKHCGPIPAENAPFVEVVNTAEDCSNASTYIDYKNPIIAEKYKGYQRDEVYRFGIVLYDKQGNPGLVNWIGDIRFPRFKDFDYTAEGGLYNYTLSQTRNSNFLSSSGETVDYSSTGSQSGATYDIDEFTVSVSDGSTPVSNLGNTQGKDDFIDTHEMYALGIKFEVSIPSHLLSHVSGYSIVRVEREEVDKTVLGIGMGSWMNIWTKDDSMGSHFTAAFNAHMATWDHGSDYHKHGELRHNLMSMDSPEFTFTGNYPPAGPCDYVETVGLLTNGRSPSAYENDFLHGQGGDDDFYRKFYSHAVLYPKDRVVQDFFNPSVAQKLDTGGKLSGSITSMGEWLAKGIRNIGIFMQDTQSSGGISDEDINTYSIGAETLFIQFPDNSGAEWYSGSGATGNDPSFPYWHHVLVGTGVGGEETANQLYFHNNDDTVGGGANNTDPTLSGDSDDVHYNRWQRFKVQEKPLLAWRRERPDQYGGNTFQDRTKNVYIAAGTFNRLAAPEGGRDIYRPAVEIWGGDIYIHFYDFQKMRKWRGDDDQTPDSDYDNATTGTTKRMSQCFALPVESTLNLGLRTGYHFASKSKFTGKEDDAQQLDEFNYQNLYSAENDILRFYPKSLDYTPRLQQDCRVAYSDVKINGSVADSWSHFKLDNYKDLDSGYGPLNKLIEHRDNIFYFQDRGVGMLSVNPVAITTAKDSTSIVLGTGDVIQDFRYIGKGIGCKHQWSVLSGNKGLYWADILTNSIYKVGGQKEGALELSRVKGLKSYFESTMENSLFSDTTYDNVYGFVDAGGDNPVLRHGISAGYDAKNNEVLFSFIHRAPATDSLIDLSIYDTIVYSETTGMFTSFYDFASPIFIDMQDKFFSVNNIGADGSQLFLHNIGNPGEWYGTTYDTVLKFITNKNPSYTKVFDNYEWHTEAINTLGDNILNVTWSAMQCENDWQNSAVTFIVEDDDPNVINLKRRERTWQTPVLRDKDQFMRFRDKYLTTTLFFDNTDTHKLRTHYVKTKFRISKR
tara:strand:+ start:5481 stop:10274 length:4794 start_codon:yes stop_codon:yes gene_type:complete